MKDKPIFSPTIAGILVHQGFPIKNQRPDYNDPSKWVYFFENTPELNAAFKHILDERDATQQ